MSTLFGFNAFVRFSVETTYGIALLTNPVDLRIISSSLVTTQDRERKTNLSVPSSGMLAGTFDGFRNTNGTVDIPIQYNGSGMMFYLALGTVSTAAVAAYFVHTFTPDFALPSATVLFQRGTNLTSSNEQFTGVKVSTMNLSCAAGEEMTGSFDLIGYDGGVRSTDETSSFPSGDEALHFESGNLLLAGTLAPSSLEIRSFELTLDNKLERKNILGSKLTAEPVISDVREVTMSITCDMDDNSVYTSQLAGSSGAVSLTFTSTADANHFISITLSNAIIEDYSDAVSSFGRIERSFTVRGLASSTDAGLTIKVKNDNPSATIG